MKLSKNRLELFSDGVIAIIATIMVIDIPLPITFEVQEIIQLLLSILIFFISFFIVGTYWHRHYFLFHNLKEVNNKIIWRNFLFLFVLSLLPIFTKWVVNNFGEMVPAVGYVIIFFLLNFSYQFLWHATLTKEDKDKMKNLTKVSWIRGIIMIIIITIVVVFSIYFPKLSTIFLTAIPLGSSIFNLLSDREPHKRQID